MFLRANQVWTVGLDGGQAGSVDSRQGANGEPRWSPDGSRIIFAESDAGITASSGCMILEPSRCVTWIRARTAIRTRCGRPMASKRRLFVWRQRVDSGSGRCGPHSRLGRSGWRTPRPARAVSYGRRKPGQGSAFRPVVAEQPVAMGRWQSHCVPLGEDWVGTSVFRFDQRRHAHRAESGWRVRSRACRVDARWQGVLFSTNQGDIDRRHIRRVSVLGEKGATVTTGEGLEWSPVELSGGHGIAMLHSDWKRQRALPCS